MQTSFSRRQRWVRAVVAGAIAAVVAEAAMAASWRLRPATARSFLASFAVEPLAADDLRESERAFLTKADEVSRHQLRFARLGVSQAVASDVRAFAQQLAGDWRTIGDALDALARRKGLAVTAAPPPAAPEVYGRLMEGAGAEFDREFVRVMSQTVDDAATLFEQAASESKDPEVRDFASAQLPVLRGHRNRVEALKKIYD